MEKKNESDLIWTNDYRGSFDGERILDLVKKEWTDKAVLWDVPELLEKLSGMDDDQVVRMIEEANPELLDEFMRNMASMLDEYDLCVSRTDGGGDGRLVLETGGDFEKFTEGFSLKTFWEDGKGDLRLDTRTDDGTGQSFVIRILTEKGSLAASEGLEWSADDPSFACPLEYVGRYMTLEPPEEDEEDGPEASVEPPASWFLRKVSSWDWEGSWAYCQEGEIQQAVLTAWRHEAPYHRATPGEPPADAVDFVSNDSTPGLLVADVHGGLNGRGKWSDYLHALSDMFDTLEKKGYDPRMMDLTIDAPDDVWDAIFTIERSKDK